MNGVVLIDKPKGCTSHDVVAQARMLQIDRVVVRGNTRLSTGEVLALLNGLRGENLVWTDLGAWRRRRGAAYNQFQRDRNNYSCRAITADQQRY